MDIDHTHLAVLEKGRATLLANARRLGASLERADMIEATEPVEATMAFLCTRAKIPGAQHPRPSSRTRVVLEAAAIACGLDTNPNESDRNLACRITGRAGATVTDDDDVVIAAAFTFALGGGQ